MNALPPEILQVRNGIVCFYVLRDGDELYLIDTGFLGGLRALAGCLTAHGWNRLPIRGILLTHGHLDHTFNAAAIARAHGAWVAYPSTDETLLAGDFLRATGWGKVGGVLQTAASRLFDYRSPRSLRPFSPGHRFEILGGLLSVPLPGHTAGHCGFLLPSIDLLFTGDLFASFGAGRTCHRPPDIFNEEPVSVDRSLRMTAELPLCGVLPNHADEASPAEHLRRLRVLAGTRDRSS